MKYLHRVQHTDCPSIGVKRSENCYRMQIDIVVPVTDNRDSFSMRPISYEYFLHPEESVYKNAVLREILIVT
jgi:hypothetical protein